MFRLMIICGMACAFLSRGQMLYAADRYWIATVTGHWNDPDNWSAESGGESGEADVPGIGDVAVFDANGNGDCILDAPVNVQGIRLVTGFTGTVKQTDYTINIGAAGFHQTAGAFHGATADIHVSGGNPALSITEGVFTNTSGLLTIDPPTSGTVLFSFTSGIFDHNDGTLKFASTYGVQQGRNYIITLEQPLVLYDVTFTGGHTANTSHLQTYSLNFTSNGALTVTGCLSLFGNQEDRPFMFKLDNHTINARGDIMVGHGARGGTTTLLVDGIGEQKYTAVGGGWLPVLHVDKATGSLAPDDGTDSLDVERFILEAGGFIAPKTDLNIHGNVSGSTILSISGGIFHHNEGTLRFASTYGIQQNRTYTIALQKPLSVNHLVYTGGNTPNTSHLQTYDHVFTGNGALLVKGDLTLIGGRDDRSHMFRLNNHTIDARGDITVGLGVWGGSVELRLTGNMDQHLVHIDGIPPQGNWTIDKNGGAVFLDTDVFLTGASQDVYWQAGSLMLSSNTFSVGRHLWIGPAADILGTTVADTNTVGLLTAAGAVSSITNAHLRISVDAEPADVQDWSYVILRNSTPLEGRFASETWPRYPRCHRSRWTGSVCYDGNQGRDVTLYSILPPRGTTISIR